MDLWAPGYFDQRNSLVSSWVFESHSQGGWYDPEMPGNLRIKMTQKEDGLFSRGGKGEGPDEQRAGLWLTLILPRSGQEMCNLFSK